MKRRPLRRDWSDAESKRGFGCRVHSLGGCGGPLELMHVTGREHDPTSTRPGFDRYVRPASVVEGCRAHHRLYDAHELDLLPFLARDEQVAAVADLGLEQARIRTCPLAYRKAEAA